MKKLLGWAITMIVLTVGFYQVALLVGESPKNAIFVATAMVPFAVGAAAAVTTTTAFATAAAFAAAFVTIAFTTDAFVAALATAFAITFATIALATAKSKVLYRRILVTVLVEAGAIFGSLALSVWWPAVVGIAVLGGWFLTVRRNEAIVTVTSAG